MKYVLFPFVLLMSQLCYSSEIVTCTKDYADTDIHSAYQLKSLTIKEESYIPGDSWKALKAKGQIGYAGIRSEVKRNYTEKEFSYKSVLDESFILNLKKGSNDEFGGELILNKGSTSERRLSSLKCIVRGELPQPKLCQKTQEDKNKELFETIKQLDIVNIKFALSCGADVSSQDSYGCNPLLKVLDEQCGHTKRINIFSNPSRQNSIAKILISEGADAEDIDPSNGQTALMKAVIANNADIADLLMAIEVDLNTQDFSGDTALMLAVKMNNYFLVRDLISKNADLNLKNIEGKSAYDLAVNLKRDDITSLLTPVNKVIRIEGNANNLGCSVSEIELIKDEPIELVLKASKKKMFLFESSQLGLELMAMPNEEVRTRFLPTKTGIFKFMCGPHGGPIEQQTMGSIIIN